MCLNRPNNIYDQQNAPITILTLKIVLVDHHFGNQKCSFGKQKLHFDTKKLTIAAYQVFTLNSLATQLNTYIPTWCPSNSIYIAHSLVKIQRHTWFYEQKWNLPWYLFQNLQWYLFQSPGPELPYPLNTQNGQSCFFNFSHSKYIRVNYGSLSFLKLVNMSLALRKPNFVACEKQRCWSDCAFTQSDQLLCYSLSIKYHSLTCYMINFKILASFCSFLDNLSVTSSKT